MSLKDTSIGKQAALVGTVASTALAFLSLKYDDRPVFYEHLKEVPFVKGYPIVGNLPKVLNNYQRIHDFHLDQFIKHDVQTLIVPSAGLIKVVMTIDPQNVEHILKTNFSNYLKGPEFNKNMVDILGHGIFNANGEYWKFQRKTASHVFNVKNFRDDFTDVFIKEMHVMFDNILDKAATEGQCVDFHSTMFKFTLDSFVYLGFGVQIDSLLKEDNVPFADSFDLLQRRGMRLFVDPLKRVKEGLENLFYAKEDTIPHHINVINKFAQEVIEQRREEFSAGIEKKDLLGRFMAAYGVTGEKLDDTELRDAVLNFIIAGRDTTAQVVAWLFYSICLQPRIEKKMVEEIQKNITDDIEKDAPALYETISKMPYVHAVFYETLRLFPAVPSNQKYALNDDVWPDGTHIKAGTYVSWKSYAQGRSEKIWGDDAKEFNPERWLNEQGELKRESAFKWPAFNAGPRVCLGQNLATLEGLVCTVMILRRYSFKLMQNQTITYDVSLTLPMKNGLKVFVEKRQ